MGRRRNLVIGATMGSLLALSVAGWASAQETVLQAEMTGREEIPPGDADGSGTATFTVGAGGAEICWEIQVANITLPATAAHIHEGGMGVVGPPVVPIEPAPDGNGTSTGCADIDPALTSRILAQPQGFYVNVHNEEFPEGAVRGQLAVAQTDPGGSPSPSAAPTDAPTESAVPASPAPTATQPGSDTDDPLAPGSSAPPMAWLLVLGAAALLGVVASVRLRPND